MEKYLYTFLDGYPVAMVILFKEETRALTQQKLIDQAKR